MDGWGNQPMEMTKRYLRLRAACACPVMSRPAISGE